MEVVSVVVVVVVVLVLVAMAVVGVGGSPWRFGMVAGWARARGMWGIAWGPPGSAQVERHFNLGAAFLTT